MTELNKDFGKLLSQGLKSIAALKHKAMIQLEDELGYELNVKRWSIEKWRQGVIPAKPGHIEYLARVCVLHGSMDKQWLTSFLTRANFLEREALIQELFPGQGQDGSGVRRNFPGRTYERLVGRDQDLARLEKYLSSHHRMGVICLIGTGGVGKTALALEIAHHMYENYHRRPPGERFEAIIWVTAKRRELLPTGIVARNPTFTDLNDLFRAISEVLDLASITRTVILADRDVIVAQTLAERRILLILDNLEDIDDPALTIFLRDLPAPSKIIVTSRHRIDVAIPVPVHTFDEDQARELIQIECERHHLALPQDQIDRLLRRIGSLPLAIVRTLGRIAWRGSNVDAELRQLGKLDNDLYEFCFGPSIEKIQGRDAHKLFMALALFTTHATRDALGHVAGFNEAILDRDEALCDLEILSLVNKDGIRFSLEPLTKVKAQDELAANADFEYEARERWIEWYRQLVLQIEVPAHYPDYKSEYNNLKSVIDWLIEQKRMDEASWFFRNVRRFFFAIGRWGALVRQSKHVLALGEETGDVELLTEILRPLTDIFLWQADTAHGKQVLERILFVATLANNEILQAEVRLSEVKIRSHHGVSSLEEIRIVKQVLEIFLVHNKTEQVVDSFKTLGNLYLKLHNFEEATHCYNEGLHILEACNNSKEYAIQRLRAALQGNLGHAAGRQSQYAEACNILRDVLKEFTDYADLAEAYVSLAFYEHRLGLIQQAQAHRQKADRYIKQLNMIQPICMEDEEWQKLS